MRYGRKGLIVLALTGVFLFSGTFNSYAAAIGWTPESNREEQSWRFYREDGTYVTNDWRRSSGVWYYLGEDGYIVNGKTMPEERWRYVEAYDKYGKDLSKGIENLSYLDYYIESLSRSNEAIDSPVIKNEWRKVDGFWYYFDGEGFNTVNQWHRDGDGKWYYLGGDGKMLTNTTTPDGYTVDASGCWTVDGVVKIQ